MPRDRGLSFPWLVVALAVVVVAGSVVYLQTRDDRPSVLLVGDSITAISEKLVADQLDGHYEILTSGAPKRTAEERVNDLPLLLASGQPDAVVVNLGTNDVIQHRSAEVAIHAIDTIGRAFRTARCVVLVTVNENMYSTTDKRLQPDAKTMNRRILALAKARRWGVVRWDSIVRKYIAEGEKNGHLSVDTIHPRPIGQKLLADAYGRALGPCLDR